MRQRLESFAADVFASVFADGSAGQGVTYLCGLLFATTSTWDTTVVRARLAGRVVELTEPVAWVVDDTGFPNDGAGSPGGARQYSGTFGRVAN